MTYQHNNVASLQKHTFEDFLMEKHGDQYEGFKDNMTEDCDRWMSELDVQEIIDYADEYVDKMIKKYCAHNEGCECDICIK